MWWRFMLATGIELILEASYFSSVSCNLNQISAKKMWKYDKFLLLYILIGLHSFKPIPATVDEFGTSDVDTFISDYINEVTRTLRPNSDEEHTINKRSHPDIDLYQIQGLELLVGFQEVFALPLKFPKDLVLFSNCGSDVQDKQTLYAVTLEANVNDSQNSESNKLVLYKYHGAAWEQVDHVGLAGGVHLAVEQIGDFVYVFVAEYYADVERGSRVFQVDRDTDTLQYVQMPNVHFASHVIMWKWEDMEVFAAVAVSENGPESNKRYTTQSPVYRWFGSHFDVIDVLPTHNPQALTHFYIRSSMFIAVANFQNDLGETRIDSEIFRYDVASGNFRLYQKLPTEAAIDIKYFCFRGTQITESYLIYTSAYHKDEEGNIDYNTPSIVYKLSDKEYFVPFQALRVSRVTSWLPVHYTKDKQENLILLAASEEGITSYQYNGWRFVPTGVLYDRSAFGPGVKSFSVFYHGDQTLISVANKESVGYETNVFTPVFKRHTRVEDLQREITAWEQRMYREIAEGEAKMDKLLKIAQTAPSVNDLVIELGSDIVFYDAEIDHVETQKTRIGEDDAEVQVGRQLSSLNSQLDKLQLGLDKLQTRIGQISYHTFTIYEDQSEASADIFCTHNCHAQDLEVTLVNGEDFPDFLANTVDISGPVEFEDEVTFEHVALIDPLNTQMINGHPVETVIDWTKDVVLDHGLKVEGDVVLKDGLTVWGTVCGVGVNVDVRDSHKSTETDVIDSPTKYFESLNASHLVLPDSKLSQVDFEQLNQFALRINGDQFIEEFQDFERIEVDEVVANGGLYKAVCSVTPSPSICQQMSCEDEEKEELSQTSQRLSGVAASEAAGDIESINLMDGEIIIPDGISFLGTVIIENGSLTAKELVDLKQNVSVSRLMEFAIPLNQPVIDKQFEFNVSFQAEHLTVDTLNGVDLEELVSTSSSDLVVVRGRKEFRGGLSVDGTADVTGSVNGVSITRADQSLEKLAEVGLANLTVNSVKSNNVEINGNVLHNLVTKREDGGVHLENLHVEENLVANSIMVRGVINNIHLENMLKDTVYKDGNVYTMTGKKNFLNDLYIGNLTLTTLNNIQVENLTPESVWKKRLSLAKFVTVDSLSYGGFLDGIASEEFGEWLLTEGSQTVLGSQVIESWQADHVAVPPDGIFNSINIHRLVTEAVFLTDNATLDYVVFEKPVKSPALNVGGRLSGLRVPEDFVVSGSATRLHVTSRKHLVGSVTVGGGLHTTGLLSRVDLPAYCRVLALDNTKLIISGNAMFKEEPCITNSVNNKKWTDLMERVWFREDDVNITVPVLIYSAQFHNLAVVTINNNVVENKLSQLVSLSRDQFINGTFYFDNVVMQNGLEGRNASVAGRVQGLHLDTFIQNVLLDGVDQTILEFADFYELIIDGNLDSQGLVNSMDLSHDVLLKSVPSNNMTSSLKMYSLVVEDMNLPLGAKVGGVDLDNWNKSAVKKSANNVIVGNIVFKGHLDSSNGIRVKGLMNGLHFNKQHLMMTNSPQQITGVKKFSSDAKLSISKLQVRGYLNDMNITEFYNQQITTSGNMTISGHKRFSSPLYADRVILPEVYQGHNLTWLETQLATPLPWAQYHSQLASMDRMWQLATKSLTGRPYYLKNVSRVGDLEGVVLSVFPLRTHNSSAVGAIRLSGNKTTLSLLHWDTRYNMFLDMPGTVRSVLRGVPSGVQSVQMPGGELAVYLTSYLSLKSSQLVSHGEILRLKNGRINLSKIYVGYPGSKLFSFQDSDARTCFVVVSRMCHVYCHTGTGRKDTLPSFPCQNITDVTLLVTDRAVYLLGLQSGSENTLGVWRLTGKRFTQVLSQPQFNPVSIAATIATKGPLIAVATRHRVGSPHPESVEIYRFNEETFELVLEQSLPSISPRKVLFASLPSTESVMYVASDNPALPLEMFVYRGILGYQLFTVEMTLPTPTDIFAFTDHQQMHFVVITSEQKCCVLQAQFYGDHSLS